MVFKPEVPSSQHYWHPSCSSIPTAAASPLHHSYTSIPAVPKSQHHWHPSCTNMSAAPTCQQHQHPSCISVLAVPGSQQQHHANSIGITAMPRTSAVPTSYCISIPATPASQLYCYPIANLWRYSISCLTLDSLSSALHFNKYPRICMHISVGEVLFLKAQYCKTSRETPGKSGWSLVIPMISNAIVHHRSYKKTLGSCYK